MITLEQIKADIKAGRSTQVYFSPACLWWTHLDDDLKDSTKAGRVMQKRNHEALMMSPNLSDEKRNQLDALYKIASDIPEENMMGIPLDPWGSPLMMCDAKGWVDAAEGDVPHFGKHGLLAFVRTHHQNSNEKLLKWAQVNEAIDKV